MSRSSEISSLHDLVSRMTREQAEALGRSLNEAVIAEGKAVGRLLDWIGVAEMTPLRERVLILCAEYASRTGQMPFDEALAKGRGVLDA